ncbi:nuclear condensing complex subunit [Favolaschia claudopus]|uniref:Nuclear condensing complex subunit n=1 Tax=Favolaschia claudopus TaxID=2862362 RepID=A0AAW0BA90_9AGAR
MAGTQELQAPVAAIFEQAQTSLANHRKNCVALYKLHVSAADKKSKKKSDSGDQTAFIGIFLDMVSRVVAVKKGPATVDRVIKFIAQYVRFVNEKALEDKAKRQPQVPTNSISSGSADEDDTVASVFVSTILEWLVQGFVAKNKNVRYETVHLVAEMISFLGEIDEDSYLSLRESLIERSTCDKESTIRAQAVSALARLIGSEDPSELQDGEKSILDVLLDVMNSDPAPEVRRAALLHVPLTAVTLPSVLTRTRDVDAVTRKLVYASVLTPRLEHPRHLSVAQREQLVQTGLGDREPAVRLAASKMVAAWFELVLADPVEELPWTGDDGGIMAGLIAFLTLFDVVGPGEAVAVDALLSLAGSRADVFDVFVFSEDYWRNLTPESAVLARAFLERSLADKREDRLESASLPVVTAFAFHIQEAYNQLLAALDDAEVARSLNDNPDDELPEDIEEELAKREVILGELLRMAVKLDYMDEIGRRKVYTVTRDMLAHPQLPPGLIDRCLDVLKEIMPTERELIRVVVEIVMDLREPEEEEGENNEQEQELTRSDITQSTLRKERSMRRAKGRQEMTPEEAAGADLVDMRCLTLVISMLERVHGNFEDNSTLEGILADLIIPAVRRKEVGIREKGLVGLGLCCLIAKSIAIKSLQLFLSQIQNAPEQLKFKILQIVFDLMVMYDRQLWGREEDGQAILTFLVDTLDVEESPVVQAVLCVGLAKLLLAGLAQDPKIIKSLLLAYVSPFTANNAELRQCLSYFFSVYCYSSADNQSRLRTIFMSAFDEVTRMHDELEDDQTMISPQQFGLLVVDWTDSRKAAETATQASRRIHAELAVDILVALYDSDRRSEDQEVLCTLLGHLHLEGPLAAPLFVKLSVLLKHIQTQCAFDDQTLDKAIGRFKSRVTTQFEADLAEVDWAEYGTPEMQELYDFIGIDMPDWASEKEKAGSRPATPESPIPSKSRKGKEKAPARKSRSKSAPAPAEDTDQDSDDADDDEGPPPSPTPVRKVSVEPPERQPSPAPESESEQEGGGEDEEEEDARPPTPSPKLKAKKAPRRSRSKPESETEQEGGGEDEEEEDARPPTPSPKPKAKKAPARRSRSKPAPSEKPEAASDEEVKAAPKPRASRAKAPVRVKRSQSKGAKRESDHSGDETPVSVPSAAAPRKSTRRSRSKNPPPPPPPEEDLDSNAENDTPPSGPVTPPKNTNGRKRVRTPGAKLALPSPADKKRRKPAAAPPPAPVGTRRSSRRTPREVAPVPASDDEFGGYSES